MRIMKKNSILSAKLINSKSFATGRHVECHLFSGALLNLAAQPETVNDFNVFAALNRSVRNYRQKFEIKVTKS